MHLPTSRCIRLFTAALLLVPFAAADASEAPGVAQQDTSRKVVERQKTFLLRNADDLSRTLAFVNETTALLKEQVEATGREPDGMGKERRDLLEWYQKYVDWLKGTSAEFELEMNDYFSRQQAGAGWDVRYEELEKGYGRLANELDGTIRKLAGEKSRLETRMKKLNTAVAERRVLVDKDDLELARELWPAYRDKPYDRREAVYKDLTDAEVLYLLVELKSLGEQQKSFDCMSELENYEEVWLLAKAEESTALHEIARVIGNADPGPLVSAVRGTIRTYESELVVLKRRSGELDAKLHGIERTGSLRTLDRLEELSRYYEKMKYRYERHAEWVGVQIGAYQADLIGLGKELENKRGGLAP